MATARKELTLEQFLELPEKKPALEFEEGRIEQKMSPKGEHSALQSGLAELFNVFMRPQRLGRAFTELRTTFGGRSYVPDVSVYLRDRIPVTERGVVGSDFFDPPDIAIEILSHGQSLNAQATRCEWYLANGVKIALLANDRDESIRWFGLGQGPQVLHRGERIDLSTVLPDFDLTVDAVFDCLKI